jgi:hypothetical protein
MPSKAPGAYVIGIDAHLIDVETDIIARGRVFPLRTEAGIPGYSYPG